MPRPSHSSISAAYPIGIVHPECLYTLDGLKHLLGIKDATLRSARRQGLSVHYKHGKGYVLGSDWIAHIRTADESNRLGHGEP